MRQRRSAEKEPRTIARRAVHAGQFQEIPLFDRNEIYEKGKGKKEKKNGRDLRVP